MLAKLIPDALGVVNVTTRTTYGGLNNLVPTDGKGNINFKAVLNDQNALYSLETYERAVMLMAGSFDDQ